MRGYAYDIHKEKFALYNMPYNHPSGATINSFGGKIEDLETPSDAMIREAYEEVGLVFDAISCTLLDSVIIDEPYFGKVSMFLYLLPMGRIIPAMNSGEWCQDPVWYSIDDIPWNSLPPNVESWLKPLFQHAIKKIIRDVK